MKVMVAGGFDPLGFSHISHMKSARELGDYLIVIVSRDNELRRKKGYCLKPLWERMAIIQELPFVDEVVASSDGNGLVAMTLKEFRPDIFTKGGDRTPNNMPSEEIDACDEIGCEIIYNVGQDYSLHASDQFRQAIEEYRTAWSI